jgi:diguanylate cyclase (GGDEF)-like protein
MFLSQWIIILIFIFAALFELKGQKKYSHLMLAAMGPLWFILLREPWTEKSAQAVLLVLVYSSCSKLMDILRKNHTGNLNEIENLIHQKKDSIKSMVLSDSILVEESKVLSQSLAEKESLYESLKELNNTMEFPKTLEVFSHLISRLTNFEEGWLIPALSPDIPDHSQTGYQLFRKEFPIPRKGNILNVLPEYQKTMFDLALKSKTPLFINNPAEDPRLPQKSVPAGRGSLTGIGLFQERKPLGALVLEGCKKRDLESLEILSIQLSMEIQKTRLYEKVKNLSIIDGLTQTYQRRHFMALLKDELQRLHQQKKTCSMLMIDIDHFKGFNDNFGHLVGDILLKELSASIQENLRPIDLVGRFGGEEFLIALPETSALEAIQIAQRIRSDIQTRNFVIHEKFFKLTISIGVSIYPDQSDSLETLIEMADKALYQAKGSGRNQVVLHKAR